MKKISTVLLLISLFSLGLAQDPGGPDSMWVEIDNTMFPPGGGDFTFKIKLYTDNIGSGNDIAAVVTPLYITSSNPAANPILDTTVSSTFSGTRVDTFDYLVADVITDSGDPSTFPLQCILGAVEFNAPPDTGITSGTYIFAFVTINLSDTTTICIDTMSTEINSLSLTTSNTVGYTPHWKNLCSSIKTCKPGDFNNSGSINLTDIILLANYLGVCGPPPACLPNEANGNCELDLGDFIYLVNNQFKGGPAPVPFCSNPDNYFDPGYPDTIKIGSAGGCVGDTVYVPVYINNDDTLSGVMIPLRIDTNKVVCDSVITAGTRGAGIIGAKLKYCKDQTGILLHNLGVPYFNLLPGNGIVAYLRCRIKNGAPGEFVTIDSTFLDPNKLRFFKTNTYSIKPIFVSGGVYVCLQTHVVFRAFSPVDLVVTEPPGPVVGDSIGRDSTGGRAYAVFNTIQEGSSYVDTLDVSVPPDGDTDIVVSIPIPHPGTYYIRVVPHDTGHFTIDFKMGNNSETRIADSIITNTGTSITYTKEVSSYKRGDPDKNGKIDLVGIVYLVNWVFNNGPHSDPEFLGNVNCDIMNKKERIDIIDIVYLVKFVFKSGPAPCS